MLQEVLSLGDKIDIKHLDKFGRPAHNARTYASQLIDFVDSDVIHISTPISNSTPVILNVGEYYSLCFFSGKGMYQCNCVVLKNYRENNIIISVVRITTNLEKFQRRQYYRLECILDMEYHVVTKEEEILDKKLLNEDFKDNKERAECRKKLIQLQSEWIPASIIDLSGGGTRFNSEAALNQGDRVKIKMDIVFGAQLKNMILGANVISSGKIMNKTGVYEHRVEFNDITKKDREDLIKYVFEQERRRRNNEKK